MEKIADLLPSGFAGFPVWYYRDEMDSWWPALLFPNVWTAYDVCQDFHLGDTATSSSIDEEIVQDLFYKWTAFALRQTVDGKAECFVLASFEPTPDLNFDLVQNMNLSKDLLSFHQVSLQQEKVPIDVLHHLKICFSSSTLRREIVRGVGAATNSDPSQTTKATQPTAVLVSTTSSTSNTNLNTTTECIPPIKGEHIQCHEPWDSDSLLFHGFVNSYAIIFSHFIKLVDANESTICQDHGASFKAAFPSTRVGCNSCCETDAGRTLPHC